jgi:regulatory protein
MAWQAREPKVAKERKPANAEQLKNKALWHLSRREHSEQELKQKLARPSLLYDRAPPELVEEVLTRCRDNGWVSDERFATALLSRDKTRFSPSLLRNKLQFKGVDRELAHSSVATATAEQDEAETAYAVWARKFGRPPTDDKQKARQMRFLLSRGFNLGLVFQVLKRAGIESSSDEAYEGE